MNLKHHTQVKKVNADLKANKSERQRQSDSPKYPIRVAPTVRAGPLRCPAELCINFTGVAFSWEEMPN